MNQIGIGVSKMDCGNADIKQYKYDEISNKMTGCGCALRNETTENEYD